MLAFLYGDVGGADQREFALVGDHEDDAVVAVLQDEGMVALIQSRHHDVTALDQSHPLGRLDLQVVLDEARHPGAGGVHQAACLQLDRNATGAGQFDVPEFAVLAAAGGDAAVTGVDLRAHLARRLEV